MVSIHRPLGYGPSTLPLRHSATLKVNALFVVFIHDNCCLMQYPHHGCHGNASCIISCKTCCVHVPIFMLVHVHVFVFFFVAVYRISSRPLHPMKELPTAFTRRWWTLMSRVVVSPLLVLLLQIIFLVAQRTYIDDVLTCSVWDVWSNAPQLKSCIYFVGPWSPFIIGLPYNHPRASCSQQFPYKNLKCDLIHTCVRWKHMVWCSKHVFLFSAHHILAR